MTNHATGGEPPRSQRTICPVCGGDTRLTGCYHGHCEDQARARRQRQDLAEHYPAAAQHDLRASADRLGIPRRDLLPDELCRDAYEAGQRAARSGRQWAMTRAVIWFGAIALIQSQRWLWSGEARRCACCTMLATVREDGVPLCDRHRRRSPLEGP